MIACARPTPHVNLTKQNGGFTKKFNPDLYKNTNWLCGSIVTNKLCCWPCLLLSKEKSIWSSAQKGYDQRWALPQISPQIRKLRNQVSIWGFANLISYRKHLRICGEKLKFTANPQSNRQCCLFRRKTAWKEWTLLFSGLMTFFFFFGGQRPIDGKIRPPKVKKVITRTKQQ